MSSRDTEYASTGVYLRSGAPDNSVAVVVSSEDGIYDFGIYVDDPDAAQEARVHLDNGSLDYSRCGGMLVSREALRDFCARVLRMLDDDQRFWGSSE